MAENFAQTLKRLRLHRKISQQELADLIGVHVRQVSKYEMGVCLPTLERIRRMAEVLEVSADELVFGSSSHQKASIPRSPGVKHPILAERLRRLDAMVTRDDLRSIVDFLDAFIAKKKIDQIASGRP
jgi:transcriptional regulator with XRE-family HTH domain